MSLFNIDELRVPPAPHTATEIGFQLIPDELSLEDPVMLRHVLCCMIIVHNFFLVFLNYRQYRLCKHSTRPPAQMAGLMSTSIFEEVRLGEMQKVELEMFSLFVDAILSCCELYFGIFPWLWKVGINWYGDTGDDTWANMVFMALFSAYMSVRKLPFVFYDKLWLGTRYNVDPEKTPSIVGILCGLTFLIVIIQVILIPLTVIFLFIESHGGKFFIIWIWGFIFAVSAILVLAISVFGAPCLGKLERMPEGSLLEALKPVVQQFKYSKDRIYIMRTFQIMDTRAYGSGIWYKKRVIIMDNLLWNRGKSSSELYGDEADKGLKDNELVAFVAHELSHVYYWHYFKSFVMLHIALIIYLILYGTVYRFTQLYEAAGFARDFYPRIVGYWLAFKYVMPPYLKLTNCLVFWLLRRFEYAADEYAAHLGYGKMLVAALLKLFSDNVSFPYIDKIYFMWYRYRPTCLLRVIKLQHIDISQSS